jgi:hypothetical protein
MRLIKAIETLDVINQASILQSSTQRARLIDEIAQLPTVLSGLGACSPSISQSLLHRIGRRSNEVEAYTAEIERLRAKAMRLKTSRDILVTRLSKLTVADLEDEMHECADGWLTTSIVNQFATRNL